LVYYEIATQNPDFDMGLILFFPYKILTLRFISHS